MIARMKQPPIFTPSGRSTTLAPVVYAKTRLTSAKPIIVFRWPRRRAARVTATAALVNRTSTPVA